MGLNGIVNLFGYKEGGETSDEEGFGDIGAIAVEVIRVTIDMLPMYDQSKEVEHLVDVFDVCVLIYLFNTK